MTPVCMLGPSISPSRATVRPPEQLGRVDQGLVERGHDELVLVQRLAARQRIVIVISDVAGLTPTVIFQVLFLKNPIYSCSCSSVDSGRSSTPLRFLSPPSKNGVRELKEAG